MTHEVPQPHIMQRHPWLKALTSRHVNHESREFLAKPDVGVISLAKRESHRRMWRAINPTCARH